MRLCVAASHAWTPFSGYCELVSGPERLLGLQAGYLANSLEGEASELGGVQLWGGDRSLGQKGDPRDSHPGENLKLRVLLQHTNSIPLIFNDDEPEATFTRGSSGKKKKPVSSQREGGNGR